MDNVKIKKATEFLEMCKELSKQTHVDKNVVYGLLEDYKIKDSDLAIKSTIHPLHYFGEWNNSLGSKKNLKVYHWRNYWTGFDNNPPRTGYTKIYLSLDGNHLCEGVKQLFSYLEQENISHTSKATSHVRTDNVIIRIGANDIEALRKIQKFISENKYIQEGSNEINPFLPNIGIIGVMTDDGRSYNSELSNLIAKYINQYSFNSNIDFSHFATFVTQEKKDDIVFLQTFNQAFFEPNKYKQLIENQEVHNRINIDIKTPEDLIEFAIILAFEKYNKAQAVYAVKCALEGNYGSFSSVGYDREGREVKVRSSLISDVSPQLLKAYILQNNLFSNETNIDNIIINYVDSVIYKHKGKILEDALYATTSKYSNNKVDIEKRINDYAATGRGTLFSQFNDTIRPGYNFRASVLENVSPSKTISIIESILYNKGIKYTEKSQNEKVSDCADIIVSKVLSKKM